MPDVIIPGPAGRLEGRYSPSDDETAPIALILHAHPLGVAIWKTRPSR